MTTEHIDTLVIGGGQAGVATSAHLLRHGVPHLVLERHRIAERWRSERWDGLRANGPVWHDRFPDMAFEGLDPDSFATKDQVAQYFEDFATKVGAPVRCGVEVTALHQQEGGAGFRAQTPTGDILAKRVVVATGAFQRPLIPTVVPESEAVLQIHSSGYRNPDQLPEGAVLVVGAGSSGAQIAEELQRAGRKVYLSIGPHDRPPRRYRGKDFVWWLGVLGKWDVKTITPGMEHVTIAVSGAYGGQTMDFRRLAAGGMVLLGRTQQYENGCLTIAQDLEANITKGDANYLSVLQEADRYASANSLDLPAEPEAHIIGALPDCVKNPVEQLDLAKAGIGAIVWATGFAPDFGWIKIDSFDDKGRPVHQAGVSQVPGLYFVGLPWLSCRGSAFIWGVWRDAERLAADIAAKSTV